MRRKTDDSHQKPYGQQNHQQNRNNQKTKIRRKTTQWALQATNKRNLSRENLDVAKNGKPQERN